MFNGNTNHFEALITLENSSWTVSSASVECEGKHHYNKVEDLRDNIKAEFRSISRRDIDRTVENVNRQEHLCIQEEGLFV